MPEACLEYALLARTVVDAIASVYARKVALADAKAGKENTEVAAARLRYGRFVLYEQLLAMSLQPFQFLRV